MARDFVPAIASQSLGNAAHHNLPEKLSLCASHGFQAIELFYDDLQFTARSLPDSYSVASAGTLFADSTPWQEQLYAAATYINDLCRKLRLDILCLQPFMHYGGIIDRRRHAERIDEVRFWIHLAQRLDTDLIQIPSSFLSENECTKELDVIVKDMREIADIGLKESPPIRFSYEALAWGTQVDHWDQAWDVVNRVDRSNFGTCLDTFNLCGRVYANPASPSGRNENAEEGMQISIQKLREQLDAKKIFYVEVCDGERLDQPLDEYHPFHVNGQPPRMSWSRNARLFPLEQKGYLPVIETLQAILESGYTGYISFEFFSRTANNPHPYVPQEHAKRAQESWRRLSETMGWSQVEEPTEIPVQELKTGPTSTSPHLKAQQRIPTTRYEATSQQSLTPMLQAH